MIRNSSIGVIGGELEAVCSLCGLLRDILSDVLAVDEEADSVLAVVGSGGHRQQPARRQDSVVPDHQFRDATSGLAFVREDDAGL